MKFEKGLYTDCNPIDQPEGTYRYAKNVIDNNTVLAKETEEGFTDLGDIVNLDPLFATLGPNTRLIGVIPTGESAVIFITNGNDSEVGIWENDEYTAVYNSPDLNFSVNHPIKGEYRLNVRGERIVAWNDGLNPDRLLNVDDPVINSINDLSIDQDVNNPAVSLTIQDSGGALLVGAYIPITRYKNLDGTVTAWFIHDWTAYINDDPKSGSFESDNGAPGGTISNKSINLVFTNVDTRYDLIEIGYMRSSESVVQFFSVSLKPTSSTVGYSISGSESSTALSESEVLIAPANYKFSRAMTQVNGQLVRANITADALPELQMAALNVRLNYTMTPITVNSNTGNHKDNLPPTFMPGEVYAFYLGVELNQGGWMLYHIPGRPAISGELDTINQDGLTYRRFQVRDTSGFGGSGAQTNMGYWENEGENYPNTDEFNATSLGGPDLRNQPVRHHRFPTPTWLVAGGDSLYGVNTLQTLGVDVSNVNIPTAVQAQIKRWKIFFAAKDASNSIVAGADIVQFPSSPDGGPSVRWSSGGNWNLDARQAGSGDWPDMSLQRDALRIHSLDYLVDPSSSAPTYAQFYYTLRRDHVNTPYSGFGSGGGRIADMGEDRGESVGLVIDYTTPASASRVGTLDALGSDLRRLQNFKYLPDNSIDGRHKSIVCEGAFIADLSTTNVDFPDITSGVLRTNSPNWGSDTDTPLRDDIGIDGTEWTRYFHLCRLLSSVHNSFYAQDVVPTVGYASPSATTLAGVKGGDSFCCIMGFTSFAPKRGDENGASEDEFAGQRIWRAYAGWSRRNWNYRHALPGALDTSYYPNVDPRNLWSPIVTIPDRRYITLLSSFIEPNKVKYNPDFSFINSFIPTVIFNPFVTQETEFPTLVIWSNPQGEETADVSWKTFPAGNRYSMPRNKGEIINVQGVRNRDIIIHHKYSLFKTVTDSSLGGGTGEKVYLQSSGFFDVPPLEVISSGDGYAGTQNKFACILTKAGYFFPDDLQGKVFLYHGDELDEISSYGMRQFFRDNMGIAKDKPDGTAMLDQQLFLNSDFLTGASWNNIALGGTGSWTVTGESASYSTAVTATITTEAYVQALDLVEGTLASLILNWNRQTGFSSGVTFEAVVLDASDNILLTLPLGATGLGSSGVVSYLNFTVPVDAAKVGFRFTATTSGSSNMLVTSAVLYGSTEVTITGSVDNPFVSHGYTAVYDERLNRIILSKKHVTRPWTISFSPHKKVWVSYHDYVPTCMFKLVDNTTYILNGLRVYSMNTGARGTYFTEGNKLILDTVFNAERFAKKVFTGVSWRSESFDTEKTLQYMDTFDWLTVMTNDQCSGRIELIRMLDVDDIYSSTFRNLHGTCYFNGLRDIATVPGFRQNFYQNYDLDVTKLDNTMESYDQRKLIDNFVICRFEYNNDNNNQLLLYEADVTYRNNAR